MQDLVEKGLDVGLLMLELSTARDRLAALQWAARARVLLTATEPAPAPQLPLPSTPAPACLAPASASAHAQPPPAAADSAAALKSAQASAAAPALPPPQPLPAAAAEHGSGAPQEETPGIAAATEGAQPAVGPSVESSALPEQPASGTDVVMAEAGELPAPSQADEAVAAERPEPSGRAAQQVPPATPARVVGVTGGLEGVAGSAIFTKVSPMKLGPNGKASPSIPFVSIPHKPHTEI